MIVSIINFYVENDRLYGFGWGAYLGIGDMNDIYNPVEITDMRGRKLKKISAYCHVMALTEDGEVWGWGYNGIFSHLRIIYHL